MPELVSLILFSKVVSYLNMFIRKFHGRYNDDGQQTPQSDQSHTP
jgi:hypothetical protein